MRLKDKVVVVTGSTKGIGRGIAEVLAREGASVVVSGRNIEEGEALVKTIKSAGNRAEFVRADISKTKECSALIDKAVEIYGRIDGLVNNAGIFPYYDIMDTTEETFDSVLATNTKGPFFTIQRALKYMVQQRSGSIVNIGSTHWEVGSKQLSAYAVSKGALHTLTRHVAHHYAEYPVRCNFVTVGWVFTPGELRQRIDIEGNDMDTLKARVPGAIPSGKIQTPEDMAYTCVFLLSDESFQVTGTDIKVNGGFHYP